MKMPQLMACLNVFPYPDEVNTDRIINQNYFYSNYHAKGHSFELF